VSTSEYWKERKMQMTNRARDIRSSPKGNGRVRANGEGAIYKRPDGRWTARLTLAKGRKDFYGKTREEVNRKLIAALRDQQAGLPIVGERLTLAQFLKDWLESTKPALRDRTYETYEIILRLHIMPQLGKHRLARLGPQQVQSLYSDRLLTGLSAQSVRKIHAILHRALRDAVRWNLVARNVADLVTPPRDQRREMKTLDPSQARRLIEAARGDRLEALYVLALTTGMRLGEILALRWVDVDLEGASLQVRGTLNRSSEGLKIGEPKTSGSRRKVALGESAIEALRRHRLSQTAERLLRGPDWEVRGLVFTNEIGKPIEATNFRRRSFEPLLEKAGVPPMRFHDLRHTAATLLLGLGVHPKIVSERLGHSRVGITLDLYSHVTPIMQREAAEAMETVLSQSS
jgi:integrase